MRVDDDEDSPIQPAPAAPISKRLAPLVAFRAANDIQDRSRLTSVQSSVRPLPPQTRDNAPAPPAVPRPRPILKQRQQQQPEQRFNPVSASSPAPAPLRRAVPAAVAVMAPSPKLAQRPRAAERSALVRDDSQREWDLVLDVLLPY